MNLKVISSGCLEIFEQEVSIFCSRKDVDIFSTEYMFREDRIVCFIEYRKLKGFLGIYL